nr:MAG TPA: hypothetical protein [Caudoviricetes sp.]
MCIEYEQDAQIYKIEGRRRMGMRKGQEDGEPPEGWGQSDEELLKEFEWAAEHIPDDAVPQMSPEEFDKIWRRIREEREK